MKLLLGSKSPRRQELLQGAQIEYELVDIDCDETFPSELLPKEVAQFLSIKKSKAYTKNLGTDVLLTADTIVVLKGQIINKPESLTHAKEMLSQLSGKMHAVYTGVCLRSEIRQAAFTIKTNVYFNNLDADQIDYYVNHYNPLDKAGAYGIQDWIGYIGIEKIEGDFFNVMGLPVNRVYQELKKFRD